MSTTEQVLAARIRRADEKKSRALKSKKVKRTPHHKRNNAVLNEETHVDNTTARQADQVAEIDRDSEVPTSWRKPGKLDAPPCRAGYVQRWVRYRLANAEDSDNLDKMLDQGWRPRKRASANRVHELTADLKGKYGQYIVKRGLILMELPQKLADQRNKAYRDKQRKMTEGIDKSLFKLDNRVMPLLKPSRQTRIQQTASRGRLERGMDVDDSGDAD